MGDPPPETPQFERDCERVREEMLGLLGSQFHHAGNEITQFEEYRMRIDAAQVLLNATSALEAYHAHQHAERQRDTMISQQLRAAALANKGIVGAPFGLG